MRNVAALAVASRRSVPCWHNAVVGFSVGGAFELLDPTLSFIRSNHTAVDKSRLDADKKIFTTRGLLSMESSHEIGFIYHQFQDLDKRIKYLKSESPSMTPLQIMLAVVVEDLIEEGYVAERFSKEDSVKPCFYVKTKAGHSVPVISGLLESEEFMGVLNAGRVFLEADAGIHGRFSHLMQEWLKVKAYKAGHFAEPPLALYKQRDKEKWTEEQDNPYGVVFENPVTFRALEISSMSILPFFLDDSHYMMLFRSTNPSIAILIDNLKGVAPVFSDTLEGASDELDHIAESLKRSSGVRGR